MTIAFSTYHSIARSKVIPGHSKAMCENNDVAYGGGSECSHNLRTATRLTVKCIRMQENIIGKVTA